MVDDVPDYRYPQLAEALASYGFELSDDAYSLRDYVAAGPDKFYYFFTNKSKPDEVLVFLAEDYISGMDYVRNCFEKEIDAKLISIHRVLKGQENTDFQERKPAKVADIYQPPEDWKELQNYAVDFSLYDFGFLATMSTTDVTKFWDQLHERLGWAS